MYLPRRRRLQTVAHDPLAPWCRRFSLTRVYRCLWSRSPGARQTERARDCVSFTGFANPCAVTDLRSFPVTSKALSKVDHHQRLPVAPDYVYSRGYDIGCTGLFSFCDPVKALTGIAEDSMLCPGFCVLQSNHFLMVSRIGARRSDQETSQGLSGVCRFDTWPGHVRLQVYKHALVGFSLAPIAYAQCCR